MGPGRLISMEEVAHGYRDGQEETVQESGPVESPAVVQTPDASKHKGEYRYDLLKWPGKIGAIVVLDHQAFISEQLAVSLSPRLVHHRQVLQHLLVFLRVLLYQVTHSRVIGLLLAHIN